MIGRRTVGLAAAALVAAKGVGAQTLDGASTVSLPSGDTTPALGQCSWRMGEGRRPAAEEEAALRTGLSLGTRCIDTAEMYGRGRSEELVGRVIAGRRDEVFLVSKVLPSHATTERRVRVACSGSLARLGTDHLDLFLLHRRSGIALAPFVAAFGAMQREGQIRHWDVSNFGVADMEELVRLPGGTACAANHILYNLRDWQAESAVLPWCVLHGIPVMAYSPLGSGNPVMDGRALARVADCHGVTLAAIALAWTMRNGRTISIPESGSEAHVRENARAFDVRLAQADLDELDRAFPD